MLARKINNTWGLWDGKPFQHPQHPEWGPGWQPSPNAEALWSAQELADAGLGKVTIVDPPFDPVMQIRTGPVYTGDVNGITATWTVTNKTSAQRQIDLATLQVRMETAGVWETYVNYMFGTNARRNAFLRVMFIGKPVAGDDAGLRNTLAGAGVAQATIDQIMA